jgi:hypothetical protein
LKDANAKADRVGLKKSGIVVRSVPDKNRFARPITIRFHISFYQGMNPYVGLEDYINWESAGIAKGKLHGKAVYTKMTKEQQVEGIANGTIWFAEGGGPGGDLKDVLVFEDRKTARNFVVKHLNATVKPQELFTPKVITEELLHRLDDTVIKDLFALPEIGDIDLTAGLDDIALQPDSDMSVEDLMSGTLEDFDDDAK